MFSNKLKRFMMKSIIIIAVIIAGITTYVAIKTRHDHHMTIRQRLMKTIYPLIMKGSSSKRQILLNKQQSAPLKNIYDYSVELTDGSLMSLSTLKGKKLMLVNTASNCGFTPQYEELEKLYKDHQDSLIIIAFPANDFKRQEKGNNEEINSFCKKNYGISFPIAAKGVVVKNIHQQPIFKWLTDKHYNGWNGQAPTWNFCKYLIDENGMLIGFFSSGVKPEEVWGVGIKK
jgi:glutathione peroxidase